MTATESPEAIQQSTQVRIVRAALHLIQQSGTIDFTLEKVAAEAGVSKGGLLYHFASKEALAAAMSTYLIVRFEENLQRELADLPSQRQPGQWTKAYVRATLTLDPSVAIDSRTLFLLHGPYPQYLTQLQQKYAEWQRQIDDDGLPPAVATLARLAVDGLWFADVFELAAPRSESRAALLEMLLNMLEL